jgi:pimeloyl-ACP methyl ester carboxylesterase
MRHLLAALLLLVATSALAQEPIVFVHGNGDTAGLWLTTFWRFESNGYPRDRLFAVDLQNPTARSADDTPQPGRSSTTEVRDQLAAEVAAIRAQTGAAKVVLVGQSRGGNTVRNYLLTGGGAAVTSLAVLAGAVSHGVLRADLMLRGSEFNGKAAFLTALNAPPGEIAAGVRAVTIRSVGDDKFAQPDGKYLGLPLGITTGLDHDAPAIAGAENFAIPGIDHRETGYGEKAFPILFRAVTGRDPTTMITPEPAVTLNGKVTGFEGADPTNTALPGTEVTVWRVDAATGARQGEPLRHITTGPDGLWGPVTTTPDARLEFQLAAPGYPTTHIYRSPFPRSSTLVHLRPQPFAKDDAAANAVVLMSRPRGYFGLPRDSIALGGATPTDIPPGVPTVSTTRRTGTPGETVTGTFNTETIAARLWPAAEHHISVIELTW